jgi:hypothetical protein
LINKGIPSRAACSADVPDSTKVFILPHVANLLRFLVCSPCPRSDPHNS